MTARQTSALHMMPSATAGTNASEDFACAVFSAASPTEPWPNEYWVVTNINTAVANAPMKLPANTIAQLRSEIARRHLAAGPRHHDQVVAGEQLGSADDDQKEAERERQAAQQLDDAVRQLGGSCAHRGRKHCPECDEGAGQDAQCEQRRGVGRNLFDAALFGPPGHGCGQHRVEAYELGRFDGLRVGHEVRRELFCLAGCVPQHSAAVQPGAEAAASRPTICTAMTLTIVIDGKIIA